MNLQTTWATALRYLSEPSSQTGFPPTMIFPSHSFFPPTSFIFEPCSGKTEINVWYNPVSTCFLDAQCTILPFTEVHFPDTQASFLLQSLSLVQSCWFLHFPASQISPWGQSEFLAQDTWFLHFPASQILPLGQSLSTWHSWTEKYIRFSFLKHIQRHNGPTSSHHNWSYLIKEETRSHYINIEKN